MPRLNGLNAQWRTFPTDSPNGIEIKASISLAGSFVWISSDVGFSPSVRE